jgi:hypothetical protein
VEPEVTAAKPPPPLPDYNQPPSPGDGYLWTPGYWGYGDADFFWVPGVWVSAPYVGALWTPGYWGWGHNRYEFFRGYWGPHIGYYGGINYGFGYIGFGYQGGYWDGGHFNLNRSVNNVGVNVVRNVYSRPVVGNTNHTRASFNGGSGDLHVRARPAELAALHEPHTPPMRTQVQNAQMASGTRAQFASVNQGRPASMTRGEPLAADREVRPGVARDARGQHAEPQRGAAGTRPSAGRPGSQAQRQPGQQRSEPGRAAPERAEPRGGSRPSERPR